MALMEHVFFHDRHAGDLTWLTRARGAAWDAAADTHTHTHTPTKDGGRVQELLRVPLSSTVDVCVCTSVLDSQKSSQRLEAAHC